MINRFKNGSLKIFLYKLIAFFVFIFLVDYTIGFVLKSLYNKQKAGYEYGTTYAIEKTSADILIFGSSRAYNLYSPAIFEKELGLTCYNAGRDGQSIFYHYALLSAILKRHTPKIVVLSFDIRNFSKNQDAYDRLSILLPFYKSHPEIRPIVDLKSNYEYIKSLSAIYPYNSLLLPIISGNTEASKKKYLTFNGYLPLKNVFEGPLPKYDYTKEMVLDTVKIKTFKAFIQHCANSKIKLYIICPPYLVNAVGTDLSLKTAKEIAMEKGVSFLDYSNDSFYTSKPYLFADYRHLNESGVQLFSNSVVEKLKMIK